MQEILFKYKYYIIWEDAYNAWNLRSKCLSIKLQDNAGPIYNSTFGTGLTVILLIGSLFGIANLLLGRADRMLQGLSLKYM